MIQIFLSLKVSSLLLSLIFFYMSPKGCFILSYNPINWPQSPQSVLFFFFIHRCSLHTVKMTISTSKIPYAESTKYSGPWGYSNIWDWWRDRENVSSPSVSAGPFKQFFMWPEAHQVSSWDLWTNGRALHLCIMAHLCITKVIAVIDPPVFSGNLVESGWLEPQYCHLTLSSLISSTPVWPTDAFVFCEDHVMNLGINTTPLPMRTRKDTNPIWTRSTTGMCHYLHAYLSCSLVPFLC